MEPVKISAAVTRAVLEKYLDPVLSTRIYWNIIDTDAAARRDVVGMTYRDWKKLFDDDHEPVWAADTRSGFSYAGWPIYGSADDLIICRTQYNGQRLQLLLWSDAFTTNVPWILSAIKSYNERYSAREACL